MEKDNESRVLSQKRARSPSQDHELFENTEQIDINLLMQYTLKIEGYQKYYCEFCNKNITQTIKIICSSCKNIHYCINCLISEKHKHDFHISDKLSFSIFNNDWQANEELILLYGK